MKKIIRILSLIVLTVLLCGAEMETEAAAKQTIYNSPYVTFSPDGRAWTTNAGDREWEWYEKGTNVFTGIPSGLRPLGTGEHYYKVKRLGEVPVGRWEVVLRGGNCIHNRYPPEGVDYHGIVFGRKACLRRYYSAWNPYCADCGEKVFSLHVYMNRDAAQSIDYLTLGEHDYYYLCPHCTNLEMGTELNAHKCKAISSNSYQVRYDRNHNDTAAGYMKNSTHMYNNATEYEGGTVTPVTHLTENNYRRMGYEFIGWNTEPDGSGAYFQDGQEIWNLTSENEGIVTLYAQWLPSRSTLEINPNGGAFGGREDVASVTKEYGGQYDLSGQTVTPPAGSQVTFMANGGTETAPVTGTQHFVEWVMSQAFKGKLSGTKYFFTAPDGNVDTLTAVYERDPIVLPGVSRSGYSFGGWYYDIDYALPAGGEGDVIIPRRDLVLYAQWVDLKLVSEDNYSANGGKGAVNLSWSQADGKKKTYQVFQSRDLSVWTRVNTAEDICSSRSVREVYPYSGSARKYVIPYTGLYSLSACGAQGGGYKGFRGGLGGSVRGTFWLVHGEVITCTVGGQNGYNGGGTATKYGGGGGSTIISSNKKGTLLIAGGGGGASPGGNGGPGGSSVSVISAGRGQSGMSGGGAGYRGGSAGEEIVHSHVEGVCNHKHEGSTSEYGGCYTNKVYCGLALQHSYSRTRRWKWGGHDMEYCPNCGAVAALGQTCIGHEVNYYNHICPVHGNQEENTHDDKPVNCSAVAGYAPGCGRTEEYFCGYPYDGYVISSKPAYGGSNYVNGGAYDSASGAGAQSGNGVCAVTSQLIGFLDVLQLGGVTAADCAAPERIVDIRHAPFSGNRVEVSWEEPEDLGTVYYHYVESFSVGAAKPLCRSNVTENTLTSGVKGYYVLTDDCPDTAVTAENGFYQTEAVWTVTVGEEARYFHVSAVDRAGNISGTAHTVIGGDADIAWDIHTRRMVLAEGENVHPAEEPGTYYVCSDGKTPFQLQTEGYLDGIARADYQVNYSVYESLCAGAEAKNIIWTPCQAIADGSMRTDAEGLRYSTEGEPLLTLYPYSYTVRSSRNRDITAVQKFTLAPEASGRRLELIPRAGADKSDKIIWSDRAEDRGNGIVIIGDGDAPEIRGLEALADMETLNRSDGAVILEIAAEDELSGLKELSVTVLNLDNLIEETYSMDENGQIRIDITKDQPIFSGDFLVTATAVDNVGNICDVTSGTTEFALTASVERMLEPHDPVFKRGESGILTVTAWGYADRVEVTFPEELTSLNADLNKTYIYTEFPQYVQREENSFMIPLYASENLQYTVTVRAYKEGKMLEMHPTFTVIGVEGTVLDEIRTRLR